MVLIAALRESRNALRVIVFIGLFCGSNGVAFGFTTWPILLKTLLTKNAHVGWISAMVSFMQIAASVLAGLGLTSYTTTLHTAAAMLLASTAVITTAIYTESLTLLLAGALCNGAATGGLFPAVETIFARSVSDKHRSVLYGAKLSADLGCGILGIALSGVAFHVMGNDWTLPIVRAVMLGSMAVMGTAAVLLFTVSEKYTVLSDGSRVPESAHAVSVRHDGSIGSYATWTPAATSRVGMYGSTSMSMSPGSMTPGRYTMSNGASGRSGRAFSISARHPTRLHRRALSDDGMDVTESAAFSRVGLLSSSISVASHRQQRSNPHDMMSPRIPGDQGSPAPSSCQSRRGRPHAVGLQCLTVFGRSHSAQSHSHSSAAQQGQANTPRDNDHTHQQVRRFWSPGAAPGTFVPGAAFVHDEEATVNAWSHFERRRSSSQRRQSTASAAPSDLTIGSYNSMARRATLVPEQMGGRHLHDDDSDLPGALSVSSGKTSSNSSGHFSFGDETQAAASPKFLPRPDVSEAVVATDSSAEQDATPQDAVVDEATNAAKWKGSPALCPGLCSLPTMAPLPLGSVNPDTPMLRQDTRIPEFSTMKLPPAEEMSTTAVNHEAHLTSTKNNNEQPSLTVAENDNTTVSIRLPQEIAPTMTTNGATVAGDASNHAASGTANGVASLSYGTMATSGPTKKENPLTHHGDAEGDVLKDSDNLQMTADLISASMSPPWWQALSSTCSSISTASILPFTVQRLSYVAAPDSFTISSRFDKSDRKTNHTNDPRQDDEEAHAGSGRPADSVRVRRPSHVTFASPSAKKQPRENQTDAIAGDASMSWAIHSMPLEDPTGLQETFHLGRRNTLQPSDFRQHKFTTNDGAAQHDEENSRAENVDNNDDKNDGENNDEVDMAGDGEEEQAVPGHSESAPLFNTTHAPALHAMYIEDDEEHHHQVPATGSRVNENDHHHCAFFSQTVSGRSVLLSPSHAHGGHLHHHHDRHSHSNSADRRSGAGVSQHQSQHRSSAHGLLDIQQFFNPSRRWSSMYFSSNPVAHPPPGSESTATAAPRPTESTALLRDYMHGGNDGGEVFSRSQTRSPNIPPADPQQPAPYHRKDAKSDTSESEGSTAASEPQSMTMMQHVLAAQGLMLMVMTVGQGSVQPYVSVFASEAAEITPVALIIAEVVARVAALLLAQMVAVLSHCGISRPSMSAPVALVTAGSALTLAGAAAIASPSSSAIRSAASLLGSSVSTSAGKSAAASVSSPLLVSSVLAASVGRHAGATAGGSLSRSMMADCMVVEDRGRWNIRAAGAYAMSAAAAIVGGVLCDHVGYAAAFCAAFALHAVTLLLSMAAFRTQDPAAVPTADADTHDEKHRIK